jgi:hypothetical protein
MATLAAEILSFVFVVATFAVFAAMGYYALRILSGFNGGVLQKGWHMMAASAYFFIFGQLFLLGGAGQALAMVHAAQYEIMVGSVLETLGGLLLVLGFRAQYKIWDPKNVVPMQKQTVVGESK